MEYAEVKEFLDEAVRDYRNARKERFLTNRFSMRIKTTDDILVYESEGLVFMADIMGLEVKERYVPGGNLNYEYSFVYDGVKFVSYEGKRLEGFAGTN